MGENGSGKSTLIKIILGLNEGYTGEINIDSKVRVSFTKDRITK